jgi:S-ribosylhomocysteine lyase LuxS involved in autoinducer biosynthesis
MVGGRGFDTCADGTVREFFISFVGCTLGFYLVGVGASTTRMVGELTHNLYFFRRIA